MDYLGDECDALPIQEVNLEITNVITVRKGRIVHQESFWDHAEALETLGLAELSEQDAHPAP